MHTLFWDLKIDKSFARMQIQSPYDWHEAIDENKVNTFEKHCSCFLICLEQMAQEGSHNLYPCSTSSNQIKHQAFETK